jgi:hypothetical protein
MNPSHSAIGVEYGCLSCLPIEIPCLCMDRPDAIIKTVLVQSHIANRTLEHHVGADQSRAARPVFESLQLAGPLDVT